MKTILLPIEAQTNPNVLAVADLLAARFASTVTGVALRRNLAQFVMGDAMAMAMPVPLPANKDAEDLRDSKRVFDAYVALRSTAGTGREAPLPRFQWTDMVPIDDRGLASLSRVFDCTVVGRPGSKPTDPQMIDLEAALFESGRPVLMAAPIAAKSIGTNILVHWNASTETARAIHDAMPLLIKADKVTLLAVEGNMVPGPEVGLMVDSLAAHGVTAVAHTVKPGGKGAGDIILAEAQRIGSDLLVKGAYTQSRFKQMIFGGATLHILQASHIPVFLSH
jgi:nucleotide-binding universal stress UspA family protein